MITISKSSQQTKSLAKKLLKKWLAGGENKDINLAVCLEGDLGGGKTTFAQGIAEALGIKEAVTSPTFLIMKKYRAPRKKYSLYHFDCYQIKNSREILDLGWEEIIKEKNNIILIEWAEKIKSILPKNRIRIKFEFVGENERKIEIKEPDLNLKFKA